MIRLTRVQRLLNSNTRATMKSYNSHVVMFGDMPLEHDTVEKSENVLIINCVFKKIFSNMKLC